MFAGLLRARSPTAATASLPWSAASPSSATITCSATPPGSLLPSLHCSLAYCSLACLSLPLLQLFNLLGSSEFLPSRRITADLFGEVSKGD